MNVLVAGGSGFIGRNLCETLIAGEHSVTALSRDPDPSVLPGGVETAAGDVGNYETISRAFERQDAVYNLVSLSPLFEPSGGNEQHDEVHRRGTENCLRAAREHDVERFIQLSALGADPDGATHYIRAKGRAEQLIEESDRKWHIVRPSVVFGPDGEFVSFTRKLTPPLIAPLPGGGRTRFQPIHVDDLVAMLAELLDGDEHIGETYEIAGPEKLTLAEIARLTRRARGQPVHILPVPMALARIGLSVAGAIPWVPFGPDQFRSLRFDNTTDDNDIEEFGRSSADLTTLSSYLGVASGPR